MWLNFKYFESRRFRLQTAVRFGELSPQSQVKFALLSDYGAEYNIQFRKDKGRDWILVEKSTSRGTTAIAERDVEIGGSGEWTNVAVALDNERILIYVREDLVVECHCDDVVVRYPAISVLGCRVELRAPQASVFQ